MIPDQLKKFGAVETGKNKGFIPTNHPIEQPQILSYEVFDVTPLRKEIRYNYIRNLTYRELLSIKELHMEGIFRKVCVKYINPQILFQLCPLRMRNVTFHWESLSFSGQIVNAFTNQSKPGKEGTCKQWRWKPCPSSTQDYEWETVENSAIVSPVWQHTCTDTQTGVTLVYALQQALNNVSPGSQISVTGNWQTTSLGETAWTLLQILVSGTITTKNGFTVNISYNWKGQKQTITKKINATIVIPIEGNVNWLG